MLKERDSALTTEISMRFKDTDYPEDGFVFFFGFFLKLLKTSTDLLDKAERQTLKIQTASLHN